MNKVTFRFFDPIIFAINALGAHWKKLFLIVLFFFVLGVSIDWILSLLYYLFTLTSPADWVKPHLLSYYVEGGLSGQISLCQDISFWSIKTVGSILAIILLSFWAIAVLTRVSLHIYESKSFGFNDIMFSLHHIFSILGSWVLFLLFCAPLVVFEFKVDMLFRPFFTSFSYEVPVVVRGLSFLLIVLAVLIYLLLWWLFFRTLLSTFFIVDNDWGAYRSLVASFHITKNKVWLLVGVDFVILAFAALLGALLFACAFALLTLFNMNEYIYQISGAIAYFSFIVFGIWMSVLANGYIYRKLLESQEPISTQQGV